MRAMRPENNSKCLGKKRTEIFSMFYFSADRRAADSIRLILFNRYPLFVTITSNAKTTRIFAILCTTYFTRNYSHCPEQGLCNGRVSVNPSVCPIDRPQQRRVCCLCGQEISIESGGRRAPQHGAQQQMWSVSC